MQHDIILILLDVYRFSMQQMFDVVSNVEEYEHFVPWCIRSTAHDHHGQGFRCTFTVGFPPVMEKYSSDVTICEPNLVKVGFIVNTYNRNKV